MATRGVKFRPFITLVVATAFLGLVFTGVALYVKPLGWVANSTDWRVLGVNKEGWESLHTNIAIVFLTAATIHLVYNWKPMLHHFRQRTAAHLKLRLEPFLAMLVVGAVVAGSLANVVPFRSVHDLRLTIRDYWAQDVSMGPGQGRGLGRGLGGYGHEKFGARGRFDVSTPAGNEEINDNARTE